jgi:all-trans-8'-apo-beta-carotenal 15,15'-oxygenase
MREQISAIAEQNLSSPEKHAQSSTVLGMSGHVSAKDFAPGIDAAFPTDFPELDCKLEVTHGSVPDFVRGTYYLNGPARFGIGDFFYRHWLDGDGMVSRVRFGDGGIHLTNRYVRSTKFTTERAAGKPVFRTFGTSFRGSRLNRANNGLESPVNVSIYPFGDHLLAFGEQGLPWELDPVTLETRGQFTFGGRLNDASPFSAHPKFDPATGEMFNFGIFFSPHAPRLYFYCFGQEGLRYRKAIPLDYPCSIHDFALSKSYAVFFLSPYLLDPRDLLQSELTVMDLLRWEPGKGSRLVVVSRETGNIAASVPIGQRYCLHLVNAFERENVLITDVLEFNAPIYSHYQPIPHLYQDVPYGGPVRFCLDMESHELLERRQMPYVQGPDFPAIDMRLAMQDHSEFWMLGISPTGNRGRKFFDQLVHAEWNGDQALDIYQCPAMHYLAGEPVFVPAPKSGGLILCQEFDASKRNTSFVFFDAKNVSTGPIARIRIPHPFYLGFHAGFHTDM